MQPTFGEAKGTNKREENQKIFGFSRARVPSAKPKVRFCKEKTNKKKSICLSKCSFDVYEYYKT